MPGQEPVHPLDPVGPPAIPAPARTHEAVATARTGQDSQQRKSRYSIHAEVEGTMAQATHVTGIRRARYLGLPKVTLEHAAAST
nr:transposase [Streptomyces sp. SID5914]